jgi:hypothetical protein
LSAAKYAEWVSWCRSVGLLIRIQNVCSTNRVWLLVRREIFVFSASSRLALGPTQSPIQQVLGKLCLGVKWEEREAVHLSQSIA